VKVGRCSSKNHVIEDVLQMMCNTYILSKVSKAIPVSGLGGLKGCKILRIPHCLDTQLTDGSKVVSLTVLYSLKTLFFVCGTYFR
jgi:hypothetical protein